MCTPKHTHNIHPHYNTLTLSQHLTLPTALTTLTLPQHPHATQHSHATTTLPCHHNTLTLSRYHNALTLPQHPQTTHNHTHFHTVLFCSFCSLVFLLVLVFKNKLRRESLMLLKSKKDDPTDQIFVFFPEGEKVGIKEIRKYVRVNNYSFYSTNVSVDIACV
jgi:RNA polymerase Rpb5, N-terminal domain